jgi:hypothetical protein
VKILKHSSLGNNEEKHTAKRSVMISGFRTISKEDIYDVFIPILKTSAGGQVFTMRVSVPLPSATDLSSSTTNRNLHPAIRFTTKTKMTYRSTLSPQIHML